VLPIVPPDADKWVPNAEPFFIANVVDVFLSPTDTGSVAPKEEAGIIFLEYPAELPPAESPIAEAVAESSPFPPPPTSSTVIYLSPAGLVHTVFVFDIYPVPRVLSFSATPEALVISK
jgi:hypothetical protein